MSGAEASGAESGKASDVDAADGAAVAPRQVAPQTLPPGSIAAIVPAAGSGRRFGGVHNKLFALLDGQPLWYHAVMRLRARAEIGRIVMPISAADRDAFSGQYAALVEQLQVELVAGGRQRSDSIAAGLAEVAKGTPAELVAVHDAARPLVAATDLEAVFVKAAQTGAAILAAPVTDTIKRDLGNQTRCATVDRRDLFVALTPQVFRRGLLQEAYAKHNGRPATDDAKLVERLGHDVALVHGSTTNLKITYPQDLQIAAAILAGQTRSNHV